LSLINSTAKRAGWNRGDARDQLVDMADAIAHASWLRNCISSHYLKAENARALTAYDVANVQDLSRRILLETLGFWKTHPAFVSHARNSSKLE
jgi:hypothetical protein